MQYHINKDSHSFEVKAKFIGALDSEIKNCHATSRVILAKLLAVTTSNVVLSAVNPALRKVTCAHHQQLQRIRPAFTVDKNSKRGLVISFLNGWKMPLQGLAVLPEPQGGHEHHLGSNHTKRRAVAYMGKPFKRSNISSNV
ncbi:hypothetical protein HZ326_29637 [Fusarium oxysporum f. sp. albedinis]|nr:hypothetical protein HZ326_29637 [Fusarium oxysporum f. sp. albedinis]